MTRSCDLLADRVGSLTVDSLGFALISLSWPILCTGMAEVLDTSVNVMWVGRELGDISLAALSNANLLWGLLLVPAFGISLAGTVRIGRSLGEGDIPGAKAAVRALMGSSLAISLICVLTMMASGPFLLECLGTPAASKLMAVEYLRILLLAIPPIYMNTAALATLQATGDSRTGGYLAVAGVVIDATLNPLLIVGVVPFPALGIAGSALAILVSQAIRLLALLVQVYGTGHPLRVLRGDLGAVRIECIRAATLVRDGGPVAVQLLWVIVEDMLMISLVNRFGSDVTAAYGVLIQLWNVILMPAAALGAATTAIVAQNIGARLWGRVERMSRVGVAYGVLATGVLVALAEVFGADIYGVVLPAGSPALAVAAEINQDATWSLVMLGGYMVWVGAQRATGVLWVPLAISAGVLAVRFPVTAAVLGRWHARAIWWSFPAAAAATAILAALYARLRPKTGGRLQRNE